MNGEEQVLLEIPLRDDGGVKLRVSVGKYRGRDRVDIRTFYRYSDETEHVATRRGVVLNAEQLPAVVDALIEAASLMGGDLSPPSVPSTPKRLSEETKARAIVLRDSGMSAREIARTLGIGVATVYRVLDRANNSGTPADA